MAFLLANLLDIVQESRGFFVRHLLGLAPETWDWKPYPECKTVRETLLHMIGTNAWILADLKRETGDDFAALLSESAARLKDKTPAELQEALKASGEPILDFLTAHYADAPLDTPMHMWGEEAPLGKQVAHLTSENFYHAGQVAYIRMATQPDWNYYAAVYGPPPTDAA
jgi:uncharacterized damage-inducible protein DinB